jgi:hypothetical protein
MCNITATFIEVDSGKTLSNGYVTRVQYRESSSSPWKTANSGDVLREGAEIRVSLSASAKLRLEKTCQCETKKAIMSLAAGTMAKIPSEVPDKDIVTTSDVKSGRANFKVDKGGFANDFKVVTPSTTLAVRG